MPPPASRRRRDLVTFMTEGDEPHRTTGERVREATSTGGAGRKVPSPSGDVPLAAHRPAGQREPRGVGQEHQHAQPPPLPVAAAEEEVQQLRSEEHTSELQSRENLVCRLLLEKKKKKE